MLYEVVVERWNWNNNNNTQTHTHRKLIRKLELFCNYGRLCQILIKFTRFNFSTYFIILFYVCVASSSSFVCMNSSYIFIYFLFVFVCCDVWRLLMMRWVSAFCMKSNMNEILNWSCWGIRTYFCLLHLFILKWELNKILFYLSSPVHTNKILTTSLVIHFNKSDKMKVKLSSYKKRLTIAQFQ